MILIVWIHALYVYNVCEYANKQKCSDKLKKKDTDNAVCNFV